MLLVNDPYYVMVGEDGAEEQKNFLRFKGEEIVGVDKGLARKAMEDMIRFWMSVERKEQVSNFVKFLMERTNFFECPASSKYHFNFPGGVLAHSVGVTRMALAMAAVLSVYEEIPRDSIVLVGLFHDVGKVGSMGSGWCPKYIPNVLKSGNVSEAQPYKTNPDLVVMPHAAQSLYMISKFIDLHEAEAQAILAHDGQYIPGNRDFAQNETPLTLLMHFADMWCCRVLENKAQSGFRGLFRSGERIE